MKALVTGATGFIGSHLCEELVKKGYEVTCLIKKTSNLKWIEHLNLDFIIGDCTDVRSIQDITNGFDYIFHLAGLTKSCSKKDFFTINTLGTENLIKTISEKNKNSKLKRFIYLSSLSATGQA